MAELTLDNLRAEFPRWKFGFEYGMYTAVHDNFEADWQGEEDGWVGNGLSTDARTVEGLRDEVLEIIDSVQGATN